MSLSLLRQQATVVVQTLMISCKLIPIVLHIWKYINQNFLSMGLSAGALGARAAPLMY